MVKSAKESTSILPEDVALLYTQDDVVCVIDKCSKKYLSDKTLTELEDELDGRLFFRANRQYIINIGFVKRFTRCEKVKLLVEMNAGELNYSIIINRENAPAFTKWMDA